MRGKRLFSTRFCLSLGAALAVATVLVVNRDGPSPNLEGPGVVFVYFPSLCAEPGVARDCREIVQESRPSFETMAACWTFADVELKAAGNPRLLANCMKIREG